MANVSENTTTSAPVGSVAGFDTCRARYGTFPECPLCNGELTPEHAHFKCRSCGWRDSCCD